MSRPRTAATWITCAACGKRSYPDRRAARRAARAAHPSAHLQEYECEPDSGRWHYGNPTGAERTRAVRIAPPTPSAIDPAVTPPDPERERLMHVVLPALRAHEWAPVGHRDLAEQLGYERDGVDSRNVLAALRLLARRGFAMPVGEGWVATRLGHDEVDEDPATLHVELLRAKARAAAAAGVPLDEALRAVRDGYGTP